MSIKLDNVTKTYFTGEIETHAVKNVDLEIMDGEFIVLLGPSGSGKSTMLNIISGLDNPTSGKISIDDEIISNMNSKQLTKFRRDNLGFIFQQYNLLQTLSVKENVEVGREVSKLPFTVEEVLKQVGLASQENKYPFQLSGGEQQRVSIARAVVKNPKIMFCDEPTGALDEEMAKEILGILQKLNETYKTSVVLITHNPSIGAMADRIIKLNSGEVVEIIVNKNKLRASEISWG
jgi:putative ABC transport system ATP-binding protein